MALVSLDRFLRRYTFPLEPGKHRLRPGLCNCETGEIRLDGRLLMPHCRRCPGSVPGRRSDHHGRIRKTPRNVCTVVWIMRPVPAANVRGCRTPPCQNCDVNWNGEGEWKRSMTHAAVVIRREYEPGQNIHGPVTHGSLSAPATTPHLSSLTPRARTCHAGRSDATSSVMPSWPGRQFIAMTLARSMQLALATYADEHTVVVCRVRNGQGCFRACSALRAMALGGLSADWTWLAGATQIPA